MKFLEIVLIPRKSDPSENEEEEEAVEQWIIKDSNLEFHEAFVLMISHVVQKKKGIEKTVLKVMKKILLTHQNLIR